MRRPGFEPGLPDWQSDVLDQTGRPSLHILHNYYDILSVTNIAKYVIKSMQKNSRITCITYETSSSYFQSFLDLEYKYGLQTVLEAIIKNEINVYTVLKHFVTFLTDSNKKSLSPGTVRQ
jgi:hypothetical protein